MSKNLASKLRLGPCTCLLAIQ